MDNIIIEKVINNNIISAYEKSGAEVIVMGRGIGFKKKQGEVVPADQISKIFRIKSRTLTEQFKELLANMPLERVRISDEIIEYSNAIVHAFQRFRAPFSGKIVHIFPEQSAAFN